VGRTKHGEFTLDQIAALLPGLGVLMPQISRRFWILYYAAQGGNWELAQYQLEQLRYLLHVGATTRPKQAERLNAFSQGPLGHVEEAITQRDWATFEQAFQRAAKGANAMHKATGHPEIQWTLPPNPPEELELGPTDQPA
jgi:hypothetical protein